MALKEMGTGIWGFPWISKKLFSRVMPGQEGDILAELRTVEPPTGQPPTACSCGPVDTSLSWGQRWGGSSLCVRWWCWHLLPWNREWKILEIPKYQQWFFLSNGISGCFILFLLLAVFSGFCNEHILLL